MRAGRLDRQIAIQRLTRTLSESGDPVDAWANLSVRPASVSPVSGDERFAGEQWVAKEQVEFRVRWADVISDLTPLDRVVYPASVIDSPPSLKDSNIYDIMATHELGRHEGLRIIAARRPDVAP